MPARKENLQRAIALALGGDWEGAHRVVQEADDDALANWIHALVHRVEGDLSNSRYWYRRCGRELREGVSVGAELEEIGKAVSERS